MGDQRNYAALDWVLGEIEDTLNDARQALEAYVENPKDTTQLRFCVTHIHQVRGSLQIVEFKGASLLADEMENLAQAIMDHAVSNADDAQEVLMRSMLQLPIYLDHVKVYRDDTARSILPLLNDIRAVRKESFFSETALFSPDLTALKNIKGSKHPVLGDVAKAKQVTGKLREMYQFAAASVLRSIKVSDNLAYIEKVFEKLVVLTTGTNIQPLWKISAALIEGLKTEEIELSVAVRALMRYLARELRVLSEQAPASFDATPREGLVKNLLYYIARTDSDSGLIKQIKDDYLVKTNELRDGEEDVAGYNVSALDPDAVRSVVVALREELKGIKSNIDTVLSSQLPPSELSEILPIVKRVADTLAVLGVGELRKKMLMQADALEELSKRSSLDEATLVDSAKDIIDVDSKLEAIAKAVDRHRDLSNINERKIEIDEAKFAVIRECQVGLEKAKEAIIEYISSQWDVERLENIDQLLNDIRGGLDMVPLPRAGEIIGSCSRFIVDNLTKEGVEPSWQTLESLADAMASVEYFLERIAKDMSEDAESLLDIAEESVATLGYGISKPEPEATDIDEQQEPESTPETAPVIEQEVEAAPTAEETVSAETEVVTEETVAEQSDDVEVSVEDTSHLPTAPPQGGTDIDEEIIEIFIEEAQEVLETLDEYLPQWLETQEPGEPLTTIRRAYHTLKGSGRMVEATEIGELAWSIENMLNRVIDGTVELREEYGQIVTAVGKLFPIMVESFRIGRANPKEVEAETFSKWAFELAEGKIPADFDPNFSAKKTPTSAPKSTPEAPKAALAPSTEQQAPTSGTETSPAEEAELSPDDSCEEEDLALLEIFTSEVETHLATIHSYIADMEEAAPLFTPPTDGLQRALHTLKGSAKMAQVTPIASMYESLESFAKELVTFQVSINEDILQLTRDAYKYTTESLELLRQHKAVVIDKLDQFLARTAELRELAVGHLVRMKEQEKDGEKPVDPRLLSIFMAEEMKLLLDADEIVDAWCSAPESEPRIPELATELKTLAIGAGQAKLPEMSELALNIAVLYQMLLTDTSLIDETTHQHLKAAHNALLDMVDAVAAGQNVVPPPAEFLSAFEQYIAQLLKPSAEVTPDTSETEPSESAAPSADISGEEISLDFSSVDSDDDIVLEEESASDLSTPADQEADIQLDFSASDEHDDELIEEALVEQEEPAEIVATELPEALIEQDVNEESIAEAPSGLVETSSTPEQLGVDDVVLDFSGISDDDEVLDGDSLDLSSESDEIELDLSDNQDLGEELEHEPDIELEPEPSFDEVTTASPLVDAPSADSSGLSDGLAAAALAGAAATAAATSDASIDTPIEPSDLASSAHHSNDDIELSFSSDTEDSIDLSSPAQTDDALDYEIVDEPVDFGFVEEEQLGAETQLDLTDNDTDETELVIEDDGDIELTSSSDTIADESLDFGIVEEEQLDTETHFDLTDGSIGETELVIEDDGDIELTSASDTLADESIDFGIVEEEQLDAETHFDLSDNRIGETELVIEDDGDIELTSPSETLADESIDFGIVEEPLGAETHFDLSDNNINETEIVVEDEEAIELSALDALSDTDLPLINEAVSEEPVDLGEQLNTETSFDLSDDGSDFDLSIEQDPTAPVVAEDNTKPESEAVADSLDDAFDLSDLSLGLSEAEPSTPEAVDNSTDDEDEVVSFDDLPNLEPLNPVDENHAASADKDSSTQAGNTSYDVIDPEDEDFDEDILDVFIEECDELFEDLDGAIHAWEADSDLSGLEEMKRALHTMKGGARLSGLTKLGDLVHDYETFLIALRPEEADAETFATVHAYQDRSYKSIAAIKAQLGRGEMPIDDDEPLPTPSENLDSVEPSQEPSVAQVDAEPSSANVVPFVGKAKAEPDDTGTSVAQTGTDNVAAMPQKKAGPQEVVRVNSDLLEELVNLAGETSISRSQLEEQVTEFRLSLDEIDSTIDRLQEQLRRLDIETEAQILFRQEQMAVHDESFDPLEMDRYSQLQQLSRSLIESASDLVDLRSDLSNKVKDAETTLLQQSRINTTLQEGLMRSRMVPFSRLVPRLRRMVRQVASELGKKVSFELDNIEGELDRNVLERMVPPFEHMLRNAVDHGIEGPEERQAAGKSETGRIVLTLGREGSNVSIRLADDGRGIDLARVRKKAIERGLMDSDANLSDQDIMQFILHAGFSTAENVTQISGRGVGMDVVTSEIKQLGGDVSIDSKFGEGTEFHVQLPFTLSVNRALMVNIGPDHFAIPLNTIEGIVRISPFELEHYYSNPDSEFEYANEQFKVRYLGSLIYPGRRANLEGHTLPLPIVLVRSAQHTMAMQVDSLMGSQEIVVKSLGAQFSTVQGLSGATIMGDGSVVVILDPHALVRQEAAKADILIDASKRAQLELQAEQEQTIERVKTVMVVDDSVTVRKVTTRYLEREGFNVITAKDGVDALRVLQDDIPDLMLLDIEMPRMDGFEVAKNVRTSSRWKEIPIIMITSRTGDKHRDHAMSLGVNRYMGKPYQEDILMGTIKELIGEHIEVITQ